MSSIHSASASNASVDSSKMTSTGSNTILKPVCKSIWQNVPCQTANCARAHPIRCEKPDCLIVDQGLPRWKILQCQNWHSFPKDKIKSVKNHHYSKPQTRFNNKANRIPSPVNWELPMYSKNYQFSRPKIPIWLESNPSQNDWFNSGPGSLENISGNRTAAWSSPLSMCGSPALGDQKFIQTVRQPLNMVQMMPYM